VILVARSHSASSKTPSITGFSSIRRGVTEGLVFPTQTSAQKNIMMIFPLFRRLAALFVNKLIQQFPLMRPSLEKQTKLMPAQQCQIRSTFS
jgi:hypothetical protein